MLSFVQNVVAALPTADRSQLSKQRWMSLESGGVGLDGEHQNSRETRFTGQTGTDSEIRSEL